MSNISYYAIRTIFFYEVKDFFREFQFNLIAPLINAFLLVLILSTIENYYFKDSYESSYINFLIPGVIMMVVMQASFNHLSEVIITMKQVGSFNDYLMSPISRIEILFSFILSSVFVISILGMINLFVLSFFTSFQYINYINLFYYLIITILIFSFLGAVTGFLSFTWDKQSAISNFFIFPISFCSGSFFSIESINDNMKFIFEFNPFYYLIDGFRKSLMINNHQDFYIEFFILSFLFIVSVFSIFIFHKGYKVIN